MERVSRLGFASHPPHHPGLDRRRFLLTWLAGAFAAPVAAEAQRAAKVARIGSLSPFSASPEATPREALRQGRYGAAARVSPMATVFAYDEFERRRMSS